EPQGRLVLARALFAQGKLKEAASAVSGADLGQLSSYAQVLQGEALLLSGDGAGAVEPLRQAAAAGGPASLRASTLLADALLASREFAAARQAALGASALPGQSAEAHAAMAWVGAQALLLQARALAADGRRGEAAPSLEEAWKTGNAHVQAVAGMLLARDRARRGREAEAIRLADAVAKRLSTAPEAEESVLFTARLLIDAGKRKQARARLARLAAKRSGSNASLARWTLAWMSYQDDLHDAAERFAEFAASAAGDEERAQGLYWQARAGKP